MLNFQHLAYATFLVAGCSESATPPVDSSPIASAANSSHATKTDIPIHRAERVALRFITAIHSGSDDLPSIDADAELPRADRAVAYQALKRFIRSQQWRLEFTSIDVFDGNEDSVDCYLRGTNGESLVLLLGYHYDIRQWQIGAYEIPNRTFARPENESYADYIARSISEAKQDSKPYSDGIDGDGRYSIEY